MHGAGDDKMSVEHFVNDHKDGSEANGGLTSRRQKGRTLSPSISPWIWLNLSLGRSEFHPELQLTTETRWIFRHGH